MWENTKTDIDYSSPFSKYKFRLLYATDCEKVYEIMHKIMWIWSLLISPVSIGFKAEETIGQEIAPVTVW